jgi:acetylornithine deacetylase/succinyl-diaminopimelate desuccinylase-like protein
MFSAGRTAVLALVFAAFPAAAQVTPSVPDPLARIRAASAANSQACSAQETSACAQANPKIIAAAQSSTRLAANLRRLTNDIGTRVTGTPAMDRAITWAVAAFREAGVDDVHTEAFMVPAAWAPARSRFDLLPPAAGENVVAEIRGRESPDEFVLLGAHLDSWNLGAGALDAGCNAALVIEAARAIHLSGVRPRRSIRFVLFSGSEQGKLGSWGYVQAHRDELDRAVAAVFFDRGTGRVIGFSLGGRGELEPGVREALAPLESWGVNRHTSDAASGLENFDFLLEGVPNLLANQENAGYSNRHSSADTYDKIDLEALKHNTAVAGVLAFALAERPEPLGTRLSRAQTEALLERTGLAATMRQNNLGTLWETGQRGRQP